MTNPSLTGRRAKHTILYFILLLALALRLGWAINRPVSKEEIEALPDQQQYLDIARNVLSGQGYWFVDPRVGDKVYAFRTPGYPLFVAACGANVRAIRIVQAVLDTSTVLAVYLLAILVLPKGAAKWGPAVAAALVAFNPFLIYFCGLILSETLFGSMLAWGMVLLLAGKGDTTRRPRGALWLSGGLVLAFSILVRSSAILLPLVLGIGAAFVNPRPPGAYHSRWRLPVGTTMLLLIMTVLTPWALRNYRVLHEWILLETNSGFTLYDGYNPDATGASDQRFVKTMPQLYHMGEVARSKYLQNLAIEYARSNPARAAELARAKLVRTWSPIPLSEQYSDKRYRLIGLFYSLPLDLLVLWAIASGNLSRGAKVFVLIPAIYLSGIHMLTVGSLRYRLPAEPALAVLVGSVLKKSEG